MEIQTKAAGGQSSPSYDLSEHVFNSGGAPDGNSPSSASYRLGLVAILTSATATDGDTPVAGDGFLYLVTVENRLHEEGTKGFDGDGGERAGNVCP